MEAAPETARGRLGQETERGGEEEMTRRRLSTELQQVGGGEVAVSQAEAPAVRRLPQRLQEEANPAPAHVTLAGGGLAGS